MILYEMFIKFFSLGGADCISLLYSWHTLVCFGLWGFFVVFFFSHWRPEFAARLYTELHWFPLSSCLLNASYTPWSLLVTTGIVETHKAQCCVPCTWKLSEMVLLTYPGETIREKIMKNTVESTWEVEMENKLGF